jgi:hypothetical protein
MEQITVALIGFVGVVIVALLEKTRKENKEDHGYVKDHLTRIEDKIDGHIGDHASAHVIIDNMRFKTGEYVKERKARSAGKKINR